MGQEATVRTGDGTMDWFKIRKGVPGYILYVTMLILLLCRVYYGSTTLDESQARIKIAGRNIKTISDVQMIPL